MVGLVALGLEVVNCLLLGKRCMSQMWLSLSWWYSSAGSVSPCGVSGQDPLAVDAPWVGAAEQRDGPSALCHDMPLLQAPLGPIWVRVGQLGKAPHGGSHGGCRGASGGWACRGLAGARAAHSCLWGAEEWVGGQGGCRDAVGCELGELQRCGSSWAHVAMAPSRCVGMQRCGVAAFPPGVRGCVSAWARGCVSSLSACPSG